MALRYEVDLVYSVQFTDENIEMQLHCDLLKTTQVVNVRLRIKKFSDSYLV